MLFSPLMFVVLIVTVVPAFLGESHFAFLGYSLAHRLTPFRRELDYLRVLGAVARDQFRAQVNGQPLSAQ